MCAAALCLCYYLSLYLRVYSVLMLVSPFPPGAQLQVRSLVFLDQQVRLTGFSGGTGTGGATGGQTGAKGVGKKEKTDMRDRREWRRDREGGGKM